MTSSMLSSYPTVGSDRSSTRRKRKKKIVGESLSHLSNNESLTQTSSIQWRSDTQQQVYSSKLFQAIRQVQRGDSSAPKRNRAVREAADRVLAATARGRSRWSRAMLTNRLRLRFLRKNNITKQQRKVAASTAGSSRPPRRPKVSVTRLKWKSMQTVQRKARVLGGLVPGCRKQPLPVVLEEVTDYIAALEMQVRAMSTLAALLSGSGSVDDLGSTRAPTELSQPMSYHHHVGSSGASGTGRQEVLLLDVCNHKSQRRNSAQSSTCSRAITASRPSGKRDPELNSHRARLLRIDQDEARLAAQGCTWYEIKASTLRESDISSIKEKVGISELYEVVVRHVHARAHRPPAGFHTFYINQIDRGLRFPIHKFITSFCDHIGVSSSQLTPNSFSSLLFLWTLLKFYWVPISTYTLMWLLQIKKLGPGKFYISTKKELGFIEPVGCDMSWRDDAHTLPPPNPEWKPDLTQFLDIMTKAEMMKALKERKANPEEASSSRAPSKEKRKTPSEGRERCKKRRHEEGATDSARVSIPEEPVNEPVDTAQAFPEQKSTEVPYVLLDTSAISFLAKPSGSVSLDFIRRLVPDQDFDLVKSVPDLSVLEAASLHFMQDYASSWFVPMMVGLMYSVEELRKEVPVRNWLRCRADRTYVLRWGCHPRRCQYGTGLKCSRRRATRGGASAELSLSAELVGLMCSGGVATRGGASAELGLSSHVEELREEREHCDVLSMQMDSDLVIYRTTLVRTFQVVTICRVDKSEALSVIPRGSWGDVARRFIMIRWATRWPRIDVCWPRANGRAVVGRGARLCVTIGAAMPHMMRPACGWLPHATLAAAAVVRPSSGDVPGSVATTDFF
ncbi:hypothetical protein F511_28586 [Dorcoceras hygrometricum]|uniref:IBH1-like N-terminal domain-containing protein n=1 Tax=Dorcoceras hygrometricum TaxID=472368 RepID=A0A2Z7BWL5_9LAMI|nr:hypothetical protein F511_28586 [Dorcoceras hygrometricum]